MSNHTLEKQLDLVINLLETLPKRMCDEVEKRDGIKKELPGFKVDDNSGRIQPLEGIKEKSPKKDAKEYNKVRRQE